jgi:hypothetical protein
MTDILAPEVIAPLLYGSDNFQLSNFRGKWILVVFVKTGKQNSIEEFLTQVQKWTVEQDPEWISFNCQVVAVVNAKNSNYERFPSVLTVFDENISVASSFHCAEEGGQFEDAATVLIDPEGYIRYTKKSDIPAAEKFSSNLRVLKALSHEFENEEGENIGQPQDSSSSIFGNQKNPFAILSDAKQEVDQRSKDLVTEASNLLSYYQWQMRERPLLTKAITSAIISAAGEALGSWMKGNKQSFQQILRRIGVFFVYGLCIAGPFFHWWYGALDKFSRGFGLSRIFTFIIQLALNQLVMTPAMLAVTLAFLQLSQTTHVGSIIRNVKNAFVGALYTNWRVWTVAQAINFQIVPLDYRVLFGNLVALWWNMVLSWTTSAPPSE